MDSILVISKYSDTVTGYCTVVPVPHLHPFEIHGHKVGCHTLPEGSEERSGGAWVGKRERAVPPSLPFSFPGMSQKSKGLLVAGAVVGEQAISGGHVAGAEDPGSQAAACRSCSADWEAVQAIADACGQLQSLCRVSVTQVLAASEAFSFAPPCCFCMLLCH